MKRSLLLIAPILSMTFCLAHGKPKKQAVPQAIFRDAHYVYVETPDGGPFKPDLLPEDRQAIFDVEKGLQTWNRYVLTTRREQAELVFVVRKGRLLTAGGRAGVNLGNRSPNNRADPGGGVGSGVGGGDISQSGSNSQSGGGGGAGAEVGPPDDTLFIYTINPEGKLGAPLWTRSQPDGLSSPGLPLLKEIENAIDTAYPRN